MHETDKKRRGWMEAEKEKEDFSCENEREREKELTGC